MKNINKFFFFCFITLSIQSCGRTDLSVAPEVEANKLVLSQCKFNGINILSNSTITAYLSPTMPYSLVCESEQRRCLNGELSGTYQYENCVTGAAASCLLNEVTIKHGNTIIAFLEATVPSGTSCTQEIRSCDNGHLNGSYTFENCQPL